MFEDRTYENIMQECLALAPPDVDLRQGGIFYDAVAAACYKIAQYYADLRHAFDLVFITTAVDEYLDRKGAEYAVYRLPATAARYEYLWEGTDAPQPGERFFTDNLYFELMQYPEGPSLFLEAEEAGSGSNNILPGIPAIPLNNIAGLESSSFGTLIEPGTNAESDEDYRERIMEKISGPAENGNRQHYKTWAESVPGVGRARIVPLFAGPNTVMGAIIGADGLPAVQPVVDRVQEFIDPITLGTQVEYGGQTVTVGDGIGGGKANIGAHFYAVSPEALEVDVEFTAEMKPGATEQQIKDDASAALVEYLKKLVLTTPERQPMVIRISAISSILYSLNGLVDYTGLLVNGQPANIALGDTQAAVLREVTVSAIV